jgi:hypothetical protein
LLVTCGSWWFSLGTPVSSTNKTEHHDANVAEKNILILVEEKKL